MVFLAPLLASVLTPGVTLALRRLTAAGAGGTRGELPLEAFHLENATYSLGLCGAGARLRTSRLTSLYQWASKMGNAGTSKAPYVIGPSKLKKPLWTFKDPGLSLVMAHPCIDDQKNIYLLHRNGMVRKFSKEGALIWGSSQRPNIAYIPEDHMYRRLGWIPRTGDVEILVGGCALMDGSLYIGMVDGRVKSLSMRTGQIQWEAKYAEAAGIDAWSIAANSGMVIVPGRSQSMRRSNDRGGNDLIVALDRLDGSILWKFTPQNDVFDFVGSFVDGPPSIIFSDVHGVVYRLELCDGSVLWETGVEGETPKRNTPGGVVVEREHGLVYAASNILNEGSLVGRVVAYNIWDGVPDWEHQASMPISSAPTLGVLGSNGDLSLILAVGASPEVPDTMAEMTGRYEDGTPVTWQSKVYALHAHSGAPTGWQFAPPSYTHAHAAGEIADGHLCLPQAWSTAVVDANRTLYIGHMSGHVFALQDADGDGHISEAAGEASCYFGGRCYRGSPGVAPGMLVTTPCDGMHVFV